jgi:hypothetical protein
MGLQHYLAERTVDGKYEKQELSAHCLACAKSEVLARYGGNVDLRGWNKQGTCGAFLRAMQMTTDAEEDEE